MKKLILIAVATVVGCSGKPDNICTQIIEPRASEAVEDSVRNQGDPEWHRVRTEACVHRKAYLLAPSDDPAETVADAVITYCQPNIDAAASRAAYSEADPTNSGRFDSEMLERRTVEIKASYNQLALLKVIEGRAGNCRA